MNQIGKKLYYDKTTGNVIVDTGERSGDVVETTIEHDFAVYADLKQRVPETVGVIQLSYGDFVQDFQECNGYLINPETLQIEFSYPDATAPTAPPVYRKPLSVELEEVRAENKALKAFAEQTSADQMALMDYLTEMGVI